LMTQREYPPTARSSGNGEGAGGALVLFTMRRLASCF
jgi:hypothetical protein